QSFVKRHQSGGRKDDARCADDQQEIGIANCSRGALECAFRKQFTEPHDIRPEKSSAGTVGRQIREWIERVSALVLAHASRSKKTSVQLDHVSRSGAVMEPVDILGHDEHVWKSRNCEMRRVRLRVAYERPAPLVPFPD